MSARFLRIKEFTADRVARPTIEQFAVSNDTLEDVEYKISIDENNFIISASNDLNKNYPKVFLCGDSLAECAFVPEGLRITDIMNQQVTNNNYGKYEFLNAAYSGNTTFHNFIVYLSKIMPLRPRHVILLMGSIDATACRRTYNYWTPIKGTTPFNFIDEKKKFPGKLVDFSYREALLVGLNSMCQTLNTNLHIATMPITPIAQWHQFKISNIDEIINLRKELNENTRLIAKNHNISLLDLDNLIEPSASLFYDTEHFNVYGSRVVALTMYDFLCQYDKVRENIGEV